MFFPIGFGGYGLYFLFALPALLLGFWAQMKVQSAFKKYSQVRTYANFSGAQVARYILDNHGLQSVKVAETGGMLSDHYDPRTRTLNLSHDVYLGNSVAAAGIAAHEAGHAIQHGENYGPLTLRSTLVPTVQIGSWLGPIIFMVGMLLAGIHRYNRRMDRFIPLRFDSRVCPGHFTGGTGRLPPRKRLAGYIGCALQRRNDRRKFGAGRSRMDICRRRDPGDLHGYVLRFPAPRTQKRLRSQLSPT